MKSHSLPRESVPSGRNKSSKNNTPGGKSPLSGKAAPRENDSPSDKSASSGNSSPSGKNVSRRNAVPPRSSAGGTAGTYRADVAKKMNVVGSRIAEARKIAGLKQSELSSRLLELGIDVTAQSVSKWEKGAASPNAYQLIALGYALNIQNISEYFSGSTPGTAQELNAEGLRHLRLYKEFLVSSGRFSVRPADEPIEMRDFPTTDLSLSAGTGNLLDSSSFTDRAFPVSSIPENADFAAKVSGDSMEPVYHDGQYVFVQSCETLSPGEVGVFYLDGKAYLKVYDEKVPDDPTSDDYIDSYGVLHKQPVLISFNSDRYEPRLVSPEQTFWIIGRVLS